MLAWELSNTLEASFCLLALERVWPQLEVQIINTDQGAQFTSKGFVEAVLGQSGVKLSMDGKGRAIDNVFTERLWRSLKYEEVYLREYRDGLEAWQQIDAYFRFYNCERPHSNLGGKTPQEIFLGGRTNCQQGQLFHIFSLMASPDGAKAETVEKTSDTTETKQFFKI